MLLAVLVARLSFNGKSVLRADSAVLWYCSFRSSRGCACVRYASPSESVPYSEGALCRNIGFLKREVRVKLSAVMGEHDLAHWVTNVLVHSEDEFGNSGVLVVCLGQIDMPDMYEHLMSCVLVRDSSRVECGGGGHRCGGMSGEVVGSRDRSAFSGAAVWRSPLGRRSHGGVVTSVLGGCR